MQLTGLLAVCDGGILYNGPQMASDRIIHEKSCNLFEKKSFTLCWFFICLFQRFFLLLLSLFNFSLVRLANPLNVFQCDWCPHLCCLILFCSSLRWEEACGWIVDAINVVCVDKLYGECLLNLPMSRHLPPNLTANAWVWKYPKGTFHMAYRLMFFLCKCVIPENIHTPPPPRKFLGGGGVQGQ